MILYSAQPLSLFAPKAVYSKKTPRSLLLLEPGEIPTTFFYALPRIPEALKETTLRYNSLLQPPRSFEIEDGTWVIIVRHASRAWLKKLKDHAAHLSKVTYLQDDAIPAALQARELPFFYRLRTWWRYYSTQRLLGNVVSEIALSTQELAARYPLIKTTVWEPLFLQDRKEKAPSQLVYFYHATLTHRDEMKWLLPVVEQVQRIFPEAWFELMGDASMKKFFKNIPRVRILTAMKWPEYYDYLGSCHYAVGLAPLLDTPFNRARSHTKLYQITHAGAAGIFSDLPPYAQKIIDGKTGLLCSNDRDAWVHAIVTLLKNKNRRELLYENACSWIESSRSNA